MLRSNTYRWVLLGMFFLSAGMGGAFVFKNWKTWGGSALSVETEGLVRFRATQTTDWGAADKVVSAHEKDRFQVGPKSRVSAAGERFGPGGYEVVRLADGELGLVSSTTEAFDWQPKETTAGAAALVFAEAELAALQEEMDLHRAPLSLQPTEELSSLKELTLNFQDFDVQLLEPPSGRRLTVGSEIHLHWTPVPFEDVKYSVEFASSMQFAGILAKPSRTNRLSVSLPAKGHYFWRVRAQRRGRATLSKAFSFEVR